MLHFVMIISMSIYFISELNVYFSTVGENWPRSTLAILYINPWKHIHLGLLFAFCQNQNSFVIRNFQVLINCAISYHLQSVWNTVIQYWPVYTPPIMLITTLLSFLCLENFAYGLLNNSSYSNHSIPLSLQRIQRTYFLYKLLFTMTLNFVSSFKYCGDIIHLRHRHFEYLLVSGTNHCFQLLLWRYYPTMFQLESS